MSQIDFRGGLLALDVVSGADHTLTFDFSGFTATGDTLTVDVYDSAGTAVDTYTLSVSDADTAVLSMADIDLPVGTYSYSLRSSVADAVLCAGPFRVHNAHTPATGSVASTTITAGVASVTVTVTMGRPALYPASAEKIRLVGTGGEETPGASASDSEIRLEVVSGQHGAVRNLFMVRDYLGAPITWIANAGGGLKTTDNVEFKDGSFANLIRMMFRRASDRTFPGLVFDSDGTLDTGETKDAGTGTAIFAAEDGGGNRRLRFSVGGFRVFDAALDQNIYMNNTGTVRELEAPSARTDAARFAEIAAVPPLYAIPVTAASLTQTMAAPTTSHAVLSADDFDARTGSKVQGRVRAVFTGHTSGDVLGVEFYDTVTAGVVIAEGTTTTTSAQASMVTTAWVDLPSGSTWRGTVRVRNQTAARGTVRAAQVEFRYTSV